MSLTRCVAQLAVAQPGHRVVFVEALQRLGGRFDVPLDQRRAERLGDLDGQHGLAGAGLALDQQRPLQRDRGVDRDLQVVGGHIGAGAVEAHEHPFGLILGLVLQIKTCGARSSQAARREMPAVPQLQDGKRVGGVGAAAFPFPKPLNYLINNRRCAIVAVATTVYFDMCAKQQKIFWYPVSSFYCLCHGPSIYSPPSGEAPAPVVCAE